MTDHQIRAAVTCRAGELFLAYLREIPEPLTGCELEIMWRAAVKTATREVEQEIEVAA